MKLLILATLSLAACGNTLREPARPAANLGTVPEDCYNGPRCSTASVESLLPGLALIAIGLWARRRVRRDQRARSLRSRA